ncbi:MAG: hypothetical protein CMJ46_12405 [Planctomyces sp.]|nr:hypothetical protein [Planctomyces sp.]
MTFFLPKPPKYHPLRRSAIVLVISVIVTIGGFIIAVIRDLLVNDPNSGNLDSLQGRVLQFMDDYYHILGAINALSILAVYVLTVRWIDNAASNLEVLRPGTPRWLLRIIPVIAFVPVLNALGSFFYFSYLYRKSNPRWRTKGAQYVFDISIFIRCLDMISLWLLLISWVSVGFGGTKTYAEVWTPGILILVAISGCLLSIVFQVTRLQQTFYEKLLAKGNGKSCAACGEVVPEELSECPLCGARMLCN